MAETNKPNPSTNNSSSKPGFGSAGKGLRVNRENSQFAATGNSFGGSNLKSVRNNPIQTPTPTPNRPKLDLTRNSQKQQSNAVRQLARQFRRQDELKADVALAETEQEKSVIQEKIANSEVIQERMLTEKNRALGVSDQSKQAIEERNKQIQLNEERLRQENLAVEERQRLQQQNQALANRNQNSNGLIQAAKRRIVQTIIWGVIPPLLTIFGLMILFGGFLTVVYCTPVHPADYALDFAQGVANPGDSLTQFITTGKYESPLRKIFAKFCKGAQLNNCGSDAAVIGNGSKDTGVGAAGVTCLSAPRSGIMADPFVRALARALKYYENSDKYTGTNSLGCYGAYQFCPFGAWGDVLNAPRSSRYNNTQFPSSVTSATPEQQDFAFAVYFDVRFPSGFDRLKAAGTDRAAISSLMKSQRWCNGWTPFGNPGDCGAGVDEGKQSALIETYLNVLAEEQTGKCGSQVAKNSAQNLSSLAYIQSLWSGVEVSAFVTTGPVIDEKKNHIVSKELEDAINSGKLQTALSDKSDFIEDVKGGLDSAVVNFLINYAIPNGVTLTALSTKTHRYNVGDVPGNPISRHSYGEAVDFNLQYDTQTAAKLVKMVKDAQSNGYSFSQWGADTENEAVMRSAGMPNISYVPDGPGHLHLQLGTGGSGSSTSSSSSNCSDPCTTNSTTVVIADPTNRYATFETILNPLVVNAAYGNNPVNINEAKPYSTLSVGHKQFLDEIGQQRGYDKYDDAGGAQPEMKQKLIEMMNAANSTGSPLEIVGFQKDTYGYRSTDDSAFAFFSKIEGKIWSENLSTSELAEVKSTYLDRAKSVAPPGWSQHQAGVAVDFVKPRSSDLNISYADSAGYKWLQANASQFGFVESYPQGSSKGAGWEPWHWSYKKLADQLKGGSTTSQSANCTSPIGTADTGFAGIMDKISTVYNKQCGANIESQKIIGKSGASWQTTNSLRGDGTGCCYAAVWAGLLINKLGNPDSAWAKAFPKINEATSTTGSYAVDFHKAMQKIGPSGKPYYEEAGLVYSNDPKTAPVGAIVIVDDVSPPYGDINVKLSDGRFVNYSTMGFMSSETRALGVYYPK